MERPNEIKNGLVTQIDKQKVNHYGQINDSIFQSFRELKSLDKEKPNNNLKPLKYYNFNVGEPQRNFG